MAPPSNMAKEQTYVCPACGSSDIRRLVESYKCYNCEHRFYKPRDVRSAEKRSNVTPLSFRQQMCREILAANEKAKRRHA